MKRFALNFVLAASLLLLLATVVLWLRTRQSSAIIVWRGQRHYDEMIIDCTGWTIGRGFSFQESEIVGAIDWPDVSAIGFRPQVQWRTFELWYEPIPAAWAPRTSFDNFELHWPWWPLGVATAAYPALRLARWLNHRRGCEGVCVSCGYNLTGNTSGVCPECGTVVPAEAKA